MTLYRLIPCHAIRLSKSQAERGATLLCIFLQKKHSNYKVILIYVQKILNKPETRSSTDCIAPYYDTIEELLSDRNHYPEFDSYFRKSRPSNVNKVTVRYETGMGKQAQLDWKESIAFTLDSGEVIDVNIFVLLLSYSRFRVYRLSLSKNQDILLNFMDEARTESFPGKINNRFKQFADDYGFKVHPCIAGRPRTKVEAPMKILDEIRAYNGNLNYSQLNELITKINNRVNSQVNQGTGRIPIMYFSKEKGSLCPLPTDTIRKPYQIKTHTVKVNHSSMFNYHGCQYSVPPEYVGKNVSLQVYDDHIHVYYSTYFVTVHTLSKKKLNYHQEHYIAIARKSNVFKDENISDRAKENLESIGRMYSYE